VSIFRGQAELHIFALISISILSVTSLTATTGQGQRQLGRGLEQGCLHRSGWEVRHRQRLTRPLIELRQLYGHHTSDLFGDLERRVELDLRHTHHLITAAVTLRLSIRRLAQALGD